MMTVSIAELLDVNSQTTAPIWKDGDNQVVQITTVIVVIKTGQSINISSSSQLLTPNNLDANTPLLSVTHFCPFLLGDLPYY